MNLLFSIIIPTYNRAEFIGDAIESVLVQPGNDFEIIVVDDGSTDETQRLLKSYGSRIRSMRQNNGGPGTARNLGASLARGEYLAFLDSDDLWLPWVLNTYRSILDQFREVSLITSVPLPFADTIPSLVDQPELTFSRHSNFFSTSHSSRNFGSGLTLVRKDVFDRVGGFIEERMNGEDLDFVLRVGDAPGFIEVLSPPLVGWRQHQANLTASANATAEGILKIVSFETAGRYPGDAHCRTYRREIIARHARSSVLTLNVRGNYRLSFRLYIQTLLWQIIYQRWRFALIYPFHVALHALRIRQPNHKLSTSPN